MSTQKRTRGIERLTPLQVKTAREGIHVDGGGLLLSVKPRESKTKGLRRTWVFRFSSPIHKVEHKTTGTLIGQRREMGLGSTDSISLAAVRKLAREYREAVKHDRDPLDDKAAGNAEARAKKQAEAQQTEAEKNRERNTLRRVCREYHETMIEPNRTHKHSAQWIASIEGHPPEIKGHVPDKILDKPIEDVTAKELLDLFLSLRKTVRETGRRVQQRLGLVFADAKLRGIVPSSPIVDIAHALRESKSERSKHRENFASLPYPQIPAFVKLLRAATGIAPKALEFTIRTAARTDETIGATWDEIDLDAGVWVIPAARMKAREQHVVHLSPRAVKILQEMQKLKTPYCFPSASDPAKPLSNMAMLALLKRLGFGGKITVHGFRSSFSTWAYEAAQRARPDLARSDVIEACLAHRETDRIKASYNRAKFEDDRKELLVMWSTFMDSKPAKVLDIQPGKAKKAKVAA